MRQCDSYSTSMQMRCCYAEGHSGEHHFSNHDETDRIRWKFAADERDRLIAENDSLRTEVERLRKDAQAARLETITAIGEAAELERQLSAALAAKDEACEIATKLVAPVIEAYAAGPSDRVLVEWSGPVTVEGGKPFETLARVTELRSIGKDGGNE